MYRRQNSVPTVEEITSRLQDDEQLTVPDCKAVLLHIDSTVDYGPLADWKDDLNEELSPGLGHAAYLTLLADLRDARILDGLRRDLIDPSVDPNGFERVPDSDPLRYVPQWIERDTTVGVGSLFPPVKRPSTVAQIHRSLREYLYCTGKGFNVDSEMIYDRERDYQGLLEVVLECSALEGYDLTVAAERRGEEYAHDVHVTVTTDGGVYERTWLDSSDYVNSSALEPVGEVLNAEVGQEIHYAPGNDGWLLVLDADVDERGLQYLLNPDPRRPITM